MAEFNIAFEAAMRHEVSPNFTDANAEMFNTYGVLKTDEGRVVMKWGLTSERVRTMAPLIRGWISLKRDPLTGEIDLESLTAASIRAIYRHALWDGSCHALSALPQMVASKIFDMAVMLSMSDAVSIVLSAYEAYCTEIGDEPADLGAILTTFVCREHLAKIPAEVFLPFICHELVLRESVKGTPLPARHLKRCWWPYDGPVPKPDLHKIFSAHNAALDPLADALKGVFLRYPNGSVHLVFTRDGWGMTVKPEQHGPVYAFKSGNRYDEMNLSAALEKALEG